MKNSLAAGLWSKIQSLHSKSDKLAAMHKSLHIQKRFPFYAIDPFCNVHEMIEDIKEMHFN